MRLYFILTTVFLFACDKESSSGGTTSPKESAVVPSSTPIAVTAAATPSPPAVIAPVSAAPASSDVPVVAVDAGKAKDGGSATATAVKVVSKQITGKNFALDVTSPGCKVAEECTMAIKLVTGGEYHVNKEYPYKFIATPAAGVAFLGKSDANTFTRAAGDFVEQGEKVGTMTVRFKPAAAGEAKVAGKYKLSVCSADQCQIEEQMLELDVPVK